MKEMKGLVVHAGGRLSIESLPIPQINDYQALVKTEACGVCNGTDLKLIHGTFKNFSDYPAVLGHEGVGRVVDIGKNVTSFKPGDRVLLPFLEGMSGEYHSGWGAYAEFAVVGDAEAMTSAGISGFSEAYHAQQKIPEFLDSADATMIVTFREVLSAIKRFGFAENKSAVIFGAGPVGLCFIKFCKLLGLGPVITFDINDEKVSEAVSMGADYVFNSKKANVAEEVKKICPGGVDYCIDAVGSNHLINQSMELIKYNGQICCYGISAELNMQLDWSKAPYNWSLNFVQWPAKQEEAFAHRQIINWIEAGVLNPNDFISDVIHFDKIIDAFKMVEEGLARKKIVIKY